MEKEVTPELYKLTSVTLLSSNEDQDRREYKIRFIKAGRVRNQLDEDSLLQIDYEPLKVAHKKGMFNNLAVFIDHHGWFEHPKTQRLIAVSFDSWADDEEEAIYGHIRLYDTPIANAAADLFDGILDDAEEGEAVPDVGFSLVFFPTWKPRDNHDDPIVLKEIRKTESIDFVFRPGADGRLVAALGAHLTNDLLKEVEIMEENLNEQETPEQMQAQPAAAGVAEAEEGLQVHSWLNAVQEQSTAAILAGSDLPTHSRERLGQLSFDTPEALQSAIATEQAYVAQLQAEAAQAGVVDLGGDPPRDRRIVMGLSGFEELEQAAEALLLGVQPAEGVRPLSGIREMYTFLSGDYEMTGLFNPERVMFANVTAATMAGICANALNKAVVNQMAELPKWWEKVVTKVNFSTLHDARWVTLGGVGELPTVDAGEAYDEMTWDDQTETDPFVKKGGYLGITLEAIDKDDTRKIQAAPRLLARAAWLTLGKSIANIFTANSGIGPTMSDGNPLFDASNHGNLLTTALSPTQIGVIKIAMMKQTELNSNERLGGLTAPYYWWVPVDLEDTAIQALASDEQYDYALADGVSGKINPHNNADGRSARLAKARERVITVPFWTDTNNYAAQANPLLYPSIGLGFRFGENPEIFSVADPKAGLMFTNDTMPVKVRYFYATGPMDWRGLHKANI